jgi:hypothetical protein
MGVFNYLNSKFHQIKLLLLLRRKKNVKYILTLIIIKKHVAIFFQSYVINYLC